MEIYRLQDSLTVELTIGNGSRFGGGHKVYCPDYGSFKFFYDWVIVHNLCKLSISMAPKEFQGKLKTYEICCGGMNCENSFETVTFGPKNLVHYIKDNEPKLLTTTDIIIDITVCIKDVTPVPEDIVLSSEVNVPSKDQFVDDFSRLLLKEDTMDVTFKFGSTKIKAHKFILSARSPVFETMFNTKMKESATNVIIMEDVTPDAFKLFLSFIYSNHYETNNKFDDELLYLGDKYDVTDLKTIASQKIWDNMNVNNAIETLIHFDRHGISQLKTKAAAFIAKNKNAAYTVAQRKNLQQTCPNLAELIDGIIDVIASVSLN